MDIALVAGYMLQYLWLLHLTISMRGLRYKQPQATRTARN